MPLESSLKFRVCFLILLKPEKSLKNVTEIMPNQEPNEEKERQNDVLFCPLEVFFTSKVHNIRLTSESNVSI